MGGAGRRKPPELVDGPLGIAVAYGLIVSEDEAACPSNVCSAFGGGGGRRAAGVLCWLGDWVVFDRPGKSGVVEMLPGVCPEPFDVELPPPPPRSVCTSSVSVSWMLVTCDSSERMRLWSASLSFNPHSSPTGSFAGRPGFSMTQSSPLFRQRLHGGSSAPTHRIFIRRQLFCRQQGGGDIVTACSHMHLLSAVAIAALTVHAVDHPAALLVLPPVIVPARPRRVFVPAERRPARVLHRARLRGGGRQFGGGWPG